MGIKNLTKYINTKHSESVLVKNLEDLKGTFICIDSPCLLYKYKYSSKNWVNMLIYFVYKMSMNNINIVFILEGDTPTEKMGTKLKRKNEKEKYITRTNYLEQIFEEYFTKNLNKDVVEEEWKNIQKLSKIKSEFTELNVKKYIQKRREYQEFVTFEDYEIFYDILESFNINYIYSCTEAETLCCFLKSKGLCDYIMSNDSDVLAYQNVNGFINYINFSSNNFTFYDKSILLDKLLLNDLDFMNMCILSGTDYNTPIHKVGICKSLQIIKKKQFEELASKHPELNHTLIQQKFLNKDINITEIKEKNKQCVDIDSCFLSDKKQLFCKTVKVNLKMFEDIVKKHNLCIYKYTWDYVYYLS